MTTSYALRNKLLHSFDRASTHSAAGSVWLSVTADNRLKVWDVASAALRTEYADADHLAMAYTCVAFTTATTAASASTDQKNSKKRKSAPAATGAGATGGLAAVGTDKGLILVWQLASGEVIHRLGGSHAATTAAKNAARKKAAAAGAGAGAAAAAAGHVIRVSDLSFSADGSSLFSVSEDRTIVQWNMTTGAVMQSWEASSVGIASVSTAPVTAAATAAVSSPVLTADSTIAIWDANSKRAIGRYMGHASPVSIVAWSPDGQFFATAAAADRFVQLWDARALASAGKEPEERKALHSFSLDSTPNALHFNPFVADAAAPVYHLCAVSDSSKLYVWQWMPPAAGSAATSVKKAAKAGTSARPDSLIVVAPAPDEKKSAAPGNSKKKAPVRAAISEADTIVAAHFQSPTAVLLVRGSAVRPTFQTLSYVVDGAFVESLTVPRLQSAHLLNPTGSGKLTGAASAAVAVQLATVLGPANEPVAAPQSELTSADGAAGDRRAAKKLHTAELAATAARNQSLSSIDAAAMGVAAGGDDDLSQSSSSGSGSGSGSSSATALAVSAFNDAAIAAARGPGGGARVPKAGSLQVPLSQALHAKDPAMLEQVLNTAQFNEKTIKRTVERLPTQFVLPLLNSVIERFEKQPNRAALLLLWIKYTLNTHTSYLLSVPHAGTITAATSGSGAASATQLSSLGSLYRTIDSRLASFKKLLKLQGRLQLILAQVNRRHGAAATASATTPNDDAGSDVAAGPITTFDEATAAAAASTEADDSDAGGGDAEADGGDGDGDGDDAGGDDSDDSLDDDDLDELLD